ncbi:hypothetical protein CAPTEDRAFT_206437 [Capitella teleta]|uniref:Uncharacterized protein n=1 Tax=Capitella teleta TaxID=283909 RepID=R7TG86_CAPTE|nr:hypothetical protein CAPTEDRAFT_206437 [Capitella teleta]|eukprot:ELT90061.1 hypothetical protein CAPTEDRAFT_206437 [Capitella teleta]
MESRGGLYYCIVLLFVVNSSCHRADHRAGFVKFFISNPEEFVDVEVKLQKTLPRWFKGVYIRNGVGLFEVGGRRLLHALDGFTKLTSFNFTSPNTLGFSSKFLRSGFYNDSTKSKSIAPYLLLGDVEPHFSLFEKLRSFANGVDNVNVNVIQFSNDTDSMVAVSDIWRVYEMNTRGLVTTKRIDANLPGGDLQLRKSMTLSTAHPLLEEASGAHIGFCVSAMPLPGFKNGINVVRIFSAERRELVAHIPRKTIPYMHGLALASHYAVIFAHPAFINLWAVVSGGSLLSSIKWKPNYQMSIYVVDLQTGATIRIKTSPMFVMHFVNSFTSKDNLIIDMITYKDDSFMHSLNLDNLRRGLVPPAAGTLSRFTINIAERSVSVDSLPSTLPQTSHFDLPNIHEKLRYKPYCYVYGITSFDFGPRKQYRVCLVKRDLCSNGKGDRMWCHNARVPTEPWFEPNPNATEEDDGLLITLTMDNDENKSHLVFLDAKRMKMVNEASLPTWVPFTIHGNMFRRDLYV